MKITNKGFKIKLLPQNRQIPALPGKSLMESLMDQGIFLRADCGGKGVCGKCRVNHMLKDGNSEIIQACTFTVSQDIQIEIPEASMLSSHILSKAPVSFPETFTQKYKDATGQDRFGIAADIGTTTIAVYLCNVTKGEVLSSVAIKNPQALYGDDVMSRIGAMGEDEKNLGRLQKLVVGAIEWGIRELLCARDIQEDKIAQMTVVGNPTMIHIFAGVAPTPIGRSPYLPVFNDARTLVSEELGFTLKQVSIQILPQVSGFIGGDILSAALAVDLENQPEGTLLVDLGTNGELLLKGKNQLFATSCATGPAFEGASLSCGMQAIPGAINKLDIHNAREYPTCSLINPSRSSRLKPSGICGTGVISAIAQFCRHHIIEPNGAFNKELTLSTLTKDAAGILKYTIVPEDTDLAVPEIFIGQRDIRSVQLGKGALITGIDFLLREAGFDKPEKIIIAGAFGSFLDKKDMTILGMIPVMAPDKVAVSGNSAGAGAVMVLCDPVFLDKSIDMANRIVTVDLACNQNFQEVFLQNLSFPSLEN